VDWNRLVELWNRRDPAIDEDQVWKEELAKAGQALADDETLDRQTVLDELPLIVAQKVFPARVRLIKESSGKTDYNGWTDFADDLERRAAKVREQQQSAADTSGANLPAQDAATATPAAPAPPPAPAPAMPPPPAPVAPPAPPMPDPMRPGPVGQGMARPTTLPSGLGAGGSGLLIPGGAPVPGAM
jgi:hypothetical protein